MTANFSGSVAIIHCEDCGIHEQVGFFGIAAEMLPGEARELLDVQFHGARESYFVKLNPSWGVKAACCVGKITAFFSVETWLLCDPFRDDPYWSWN